MARNCKVIATCFAGREVRLEHDNCGHPPGRFLHAQNFPDSDGVLELVTLVRELEGKVDPGAECDTIIVNNDIGWKKGNSYLDSIDGTRTFSGKLKVLHRENFGTSLGAFNHAFEMLGEHYDFWTFTEDDILINGDRWLAHCLQAFERQDQAGFVAIQGLSADHALHAHAGVGLTSASVLSTVRETWGALPHRLRSETQSDEDHMIFGEVLFTNIISRLGYRLITADSTTPLYEFAYDYMMRERGLQVKTRKPGLVPRLLRKVSRVTDAWATQIEEPGGG